MPDNEQEIEEQIDIAPETNEAPIEQATSIDPYDIPAFPAAMVQLEIAKNEYDREKGRSDSLDNKAGIYIAAIVAIITVFIQILPFPDIVGKYVSASKLQACVLSVILVVLFFGLIKICWAFRDLTRAIALKDFKRVALDNLTDTRLLASPEDQTAEAMIRHFNEIITHNEKVNSDKAADLSKGLKGSIVGFVILSISTVALLIVNGWIT